jgi:hypothetical protein
MEGEAFGLADTLYVFEPGMGRVTVFSPDYQLVRIAPFPSNPMMGVLALGGDRFVLSAMIGRTPGGGAPEMLAEPLHLVSDGKIVRSFGMDSTYVPASVQDQERKGRALGRSTRGRVWSAHNLRYVVERWDTSGTHELSIVRDVDWFPQVRPKSGHPMQVRPAPVLLGVWEDSKGRVWTLIRVADARWRARTQGKSSIAGAGSIGRPPDELQDSLYDSILEVFDPERGVLLASRRLPQHLGFAGPGFVYSQRVSTDGAFKKEIWRLGMGETRPAGKSTRARSATSSLERQ